MCVPLLYSLFSESTRVALSCVTCSLGLSVPFFSLKCSFLVFFYLFLTPKGGLLVGSLGRKKEEGSDVCRVRKGRGIGHIFCSRLPGRHSGVNSGTPRRRHSDALQEMRKQSGGHVIMLKKNSLRAFKITCSHFVITWASQTCTLGPLGIL